MRSKFGFVKATSGRATRCSPIRVVRVAKYEKVDETIPVCLIE